MQKERTGCGLFEDIEFFLKLSTLHPSKCGKDSQLFPEVTALNIFDIVILSFKDKASN
jgi:hypothetical protein